MNLPKEIQLEIILRLPVKSICQLRCVSKSLLQIIDSRLFKSIHSRSLILTNTTRAEEPRIVTVFIRSNQPKSAGTLRSYADALSVRKPGNFYLTSSEILSTKNFTPCFSFYNLLFFKDFTQGDCFLFDPFRKDVLSLPNSENIHRTMFGKDTCVTKFDSHGMGYDRINNTYKIIRITKFGIYGNFPDQSRNVALPHVLGTSSWREIEDSPYTNCMGNYFSEIGRVCAYGDMHWCFHNCDGNKFIRSFDFTKEEFFFTPHPNTAAYAKDSYITLKGRLTVVSVNLGGENIDVWVMKDYDTKEWNLEYHLDLPEDIYRRYNFRRYNWNCSEWDHGVFFVLECNKFFIFDLRYTHPRDFLMLIKGDYWKDGRHYAFDLRRTFIMLKQFENLVQDSKAVEDR